MVGYQTIKIPGSSSGAAFSLFTVTFKNVGNGDFPLNAIKVLNSKMEPMDGSTGRACVDTLKVQKLDSAKAEVMDSETYQYSTRIKTGAAWHKAKVATALEDTVTLKSGEGVYVTNTQKEDLYLQVSGEVIVNPVSFPIPYSATGAAFSVFGNFTPVEIPINTIKVLNADKVELDGTTGLASVDTIKIQKLDSAKAEVMDDETYQYSTRIKTGAAWHKAKVATKLEDSVTLKPGEAVYVTNQQKAEIYFQLMNPITGTY